MQSLPLARLRWAPEIGMAGILAIVVAVPVISIYQTWAAHRAMQRDWTISGPPCPSAPPPVRRTRPLKVFDYGGATFTRRYGHASCVAWKEGAAGRLVSVCQFNAPGRLAVSTGQGTMAGYAPGVGRRVTVTIREGRAACVMGGWF